MTSLVYPPPEPSRALATLILAHGAGAPQSNAFMVTFAQGLARRGCHAVTFNFPYTEQGRRLPDRAPALEACFRDVIAAIRTRPDLAAAPLVIGGKSMGGRMASHLAARGVADLAGLVALGYPLHPPGRPEQLRSEHLARIRQPLLIVQGSRDAFGTPEELRPALAPLGAAATLPRRRGRRPLVQGSEAGPGHTGRRLRAGAGRDRPLDRRAGRQSRLSSHSGVRLMAQEFSST